MTDGMFLKTARLDPTPGLELLDSSTEEDCTGAEDVSVFRPCLPLNLAPKDNVHILYRLKKKLPDDVKVEKKWVGAHLSGMDFIDG